MCFRPRLQIQLKGKYRFVVLKQIIKPDFRKKARQDYFASFVNFKVGGETISYSKNGFFIIKLFTMEDCA